MICGRSKFMVERFEFPTLRHCNGMQRLATLRLLSSLRRPLSSTPRLRALEDPLLFDVKPAQVDEAFNELVAGKGYYVLKGGFSTEYALTARDRILELVRLENSRATHFTGWSWLILPTC